MESQIISYYNPNFQSQSRAARPADSLMGMIGENVEITRLKEKVERLEEYIGEIKQVEEDQQELIREWEHIGISRWGLDTPDDVEYSIQELVDEKNEAEEQVEELEDMLEAKEANFKELIGVAMKKAHNYGGRVDELEEELEAEKKQRYEDNEKAREVITECCNENKQLKDVMGDIDKFVLHQQEILEKEGYVLDSEKGEWKKEEAKVEICPDDVNPCDDGWVEKPTRVKDLLEIDDGYLADSEGEVWKRCDPKFGHLGKAVADGMMEVFQERGITIIDGDTPKRTRSGKCY